MEKTDNAKSIELSDIQLYVQDISAQTDFYKELVGFEIIKKEEKSISLGSEGKVHLTLTSQPDYEFPPRNEAGLYHSAFVFKTRAQLSAAVARILEKRSDLYQGSSDHGATEAFYFSDPEQNGVELYFDKPLSEVALDSEGKPIMQSVYLDEAAYVETHLDKSDMTPIIKVGHVHLKVGDIETAKSFYVEKLYFDTMFEMPSALFISKDNYHHHLGLNTWESLGAGERPASRSGLKSFKIEYLDRELFAEVLKSLEGSENFVKTSESEYSMRDPWGNTIVLT